jgi:hypothetical protein
MSDQIVITEKTSQAKDVRAAVGSRYGDILPAEGHPSRKPKAQSIATLMTEIAISVNIRAAPARESGARSECRLSSLTGIAAKTHDSGECLHSNVRSSEDPPIRGRPLSLLKRPWLCFPRSAMSAKRRHQPAASRKWRPFGDGVVGPTIDLSGPPLKPAFLTQSRLTGYRAGRPFLWYCMAVRMPCPKPGRSLRS